jgi:hypothetical protein
MKKDQERRAVAWRFFEDLRHHLSEETKDKECVRRTVENSVRDAKASSSKGDKCKAFPEGAFLNVYVLPKVHGFLQELPAVGKAGARDSLLTESFRSNRQIASRSPASLYKQPFSKGLGSSLSQMRSRWWSEGGASLVQQACPDLAFGPPCPFTTVFEAKYFKTGGVDAARTVLIKGIHEAFFYRGLPNFDSRSLYGWQYEYACFLAYDATQSSSLASAWTELSETLVGRSIWEAANIFVMILPE